MIRRYCLLTLVLALATLLLAQEAKEGQQQAPPQLVREITATEADSVQFYLTAEEAQMLHDALSELELSLAWDELPDDAILPITREQAEELIAVLVVEARAPFQLQKQREEALRCLKMERLKDRLLDQMLAETYTAPLQYRIDQLERMVYALLASGNGNVDPTIFHNYTVPTPYGYMPYPPYAGSVYQGQDVRTAEQNATQAQGVTTLQSEQGMVPSVQNNSSSDSLQMIVPKQSLVQDTTAEDLTTINISPNAPQQRLELFKTQIFFEFDSSTLTKEAQALLDDVVAWMKSNRLAVSLNGYASLEGRTSYNNKLSGRRVKAVADYLIEQGIPESRIVQIPSGIDSIQENKSDYHTARRVDIRPVLY